MEQPANFFQVVLIGTTVAVLPLLAVVMSSYTKIVVVFYIVRNALGVQQTPPNLALNGLAVILSLYIMAPVVSEAYQEIKDHDRYQTFEDFEYAYTKASQPIRAFLTDHSTPKGRQFFIVSADKVWGDRAHSLPQSTDLIVLVPAFMVAELTKAFEIGFLLYLPFVAIDLVVTNLLMALGMMMVSPVVLSVPFKLFLFVIVDGWTRMVNGLVLSYAVPGGG